ncbi:alpha/beta hydrolase [Haloarcula amylovorans]|uniref:alpha/beta hydrolase n=1 Tax=Haloarcula amylovorans TaxID=2562280 RepID=UPI001076BDCF|nr:alpha/beta hydrolase [Halomicroarcula amylolytica]
MSYYCPPITVTSRPLPDAFLPPTDAVTDVTANTDATVTVERDIPFREVDGRTLLLDRYEATAASGPKPVAILVRGGAFRYGDKGEFSRHAIDLAAEGYVVVEPQYRLAPEWTFPAPLVDVKAAIEWCRAEGVSGDPQGVVAVGHSAGASLVLLAAATADEPGFEPERYPGASSALDAVVGYSGIYDFRALGIEDGDHELAAYLGGGPEEIPEAYDLASPVGQVDAAMPPTLLLHGEDDDVVPLQQSELMAEALTPLTDVDYEPVPGGHAFPFHGGFYDDVYDRTAAFLGQHAGVAAGPGSGPDERLSGGGGPDRQSPGGGPSGGKPPVDDPTVGPNRRGN